MTYTIPLHPDCLDWLAEQPVEVQGLLGYTLVERGIPRKAGETNYDITVEELENALVLYYGWDYSSHAITTPDEYVFIPAHSPLANRLITIFYKALPYFLCFMVGLAFGMDWNI